MSPRVRLLLGCCLLVGVLGLLVWQLEKTEDVPGQSAESSAEARRPAEPTANQDAAMQGGAMPSPHAPPIEAQRPGSTPASLRDTDIDGRLVTDVRGALVVDRELRRLFDYLLAGASEQPLGVLRQRLRDLALIQGGETLATQALEEFDRYLAYLQAEAELGRRPSDDLQARLDALIALRRRQLGAATAEAYFGEEERYAQATLDRDHDADPAWREERRVATEQQRALEQTEQFEQLGLDAEQRWAEREALYGADAADRLADLDAQQAVWDARMQDWATRRAALQADRSMTPAQQDQAMQDLFESLFDEAERRRVQALEGEGG